MLPVDFDLGWEEGTTKTLEILYDVVFRAIISHAAGAWGIPAGGSHIRRHYLAIQRAMLLMIISAYRTVSRNALQVIAGVMHLHLEK